MTGGHRGARLWLLPLALSGAVALAHPYPVTIDRLKEWTASLEKKGIALAPVSALPAPQRTQ